MFYFLLVSYGKIRLASQTSPFFTESFSPVKTQKEVILWTVDSEIVKDFKMRIMGCFLNTISRMIEVSSNRH